MQQDNKVASAEDREEAAESGQDQTLQWLIEQDYEEQSEKLFALSQEQQGEVALSAKELELASRPMSSGDRNLDDLSTVAAEEIVVGDIGSGRDIYDLDLGVEFEGGENDPAPLAVDHSAPWDDLSGGAAVEDVLADGTDILELLDEDDMGEQFLTIKKVVTEPEPEAEPAALVEESLPELTEVESRHDDADGEPAENSIVAGSEVLDYISGYRPPKDDEDFDRYLLQGSHLQSDEADIDALVLESTDGVVAVDPEPVSSIDYHEDFSEACNDAEGGSGFALAVARQMSQLSEAVAQRLAELGEQPGAVEIDMMLGSEPDALVRSVEEGYVPLAQTGLNGVEALLEQGEEELYVRLQHTATGACWNGLLRDDFEAPGAAVADAPEAGFDELDADFEAFTEQTDEEALEAGLEALETSADEDELLDILDGFDGIDAEEPLPQLQEQPAQEDTELEAAMEPADAEGGESGFDPLGELDQLDDFDAGATGSMDVDAMLDSFGDSEGDDLLSMEIQAFTDTDKVADAPAVEVPEELRWCVPAGIPFSESSASGGELFADFLDAFIEEAEGELEKLEDAVGAWESDIASEQAYAPVPRILHTLKGIAKGVGLQRYGTLIHNFETLLEGLARPQAGAEGGYFGIVNAWLDAAVRGFHHIREQRQDVASEFPLAGSAPVQPEEVEQEPQAPETEPVEAPPSLSVDELNQRLGAPRQSDAQIADEGAKVLAAQQSIRMTPEAVDHLLNLTNQTQQLGVRASQATLQSKGATAELQGRLSSVRAHIAKIADRALANVTAMGNRLGDEMDALEMDQYSELQEAANILREGVEDLDDLINLSSRQNGQIEALLKQQASVVSFLGSAIQAARVVPVSRLMPGLRRIVRTVSSDLGKAVQFRVLNEVGSLDRDNHARCQIVLEHMVRNALDHGIESPAERIAAGKPTAGQISIDVSKVGGDYVIELRDDGRGIDPDLMRETAFNKGLDVDVDALSDAEAQRLIFHKGFSTADSVSEISGRGVGMDVVLSELQHIGGDIDIESEVGVGTTFRVRVPSNMTLNGALLVTAGQVSYAIPLEGLIAVEHVARDTFYDAVESGSRLTLFGLECEPSYLATLCHNEGLPERGAWSNRTVPVIIAGSGERHMAIAVDDVKQALELVIRSLGSQFSTVPGVTGAATSADGQAIIAMDLNALVASVSPEEQSALAVEKASNEHMLVLVVDDSRTQRLVATRAFDGIGVETVTAENGQVALDVLNSTHRLPDVVLLDVEMPVKDGIQTLRDIRKNPRLQDLPVIMVTSRTGAKHRSLAEEAGCNGYMGKPFNFPVLVEMIAEQTGRDLQLV